MKSRNLVLAGLLLIGVWTAAESLAQLPGEVARIYTLSSGSQLTDDCPICDRVPVVVPMTGTFRLRFLEETPLATRYQIENISFHAGTKGGPDYWVTGSGTYQVGGEVVVAQDVFLDVSINDGTVNVSALCVNRDPSVTRPWPEIQSSVDQTNGTAAKLYSLKWAAVPALQFRAALPDRRAGNILLQWDSHGGQVQLERAETVGGPYSPISPVTTNQAFTDVGALTNRVMFYRLRQ